MFHGKRDQAATLNRMRELVQWYSPDADFIEALGRERQWYRWTGLKYMLYEWEHHLAGKRAVQLDWERVEQRDAAKSIEHILPQTPTKDYWQSQFPDPAERERLTHDLGNLVLTEDNSVYLNRSFPDKRGKLGALGKDGSLSRCYANSPLFQEKRIAELAEWSPDAINSRRREILDLARQRWHVEPPTKAEGVATEDEAADEAADENAVGLTSGEPDE
jgi:hypothetical protein